MRIRKIPWETIVAVQLDYLNHLSTLGITMQGHQYAGPQPTLDGSAHAFAQLLRVIEAEGWRQREGVETLVKRIEKGIEICNQRGTT